MNPSLSVILPVHNEEKNIETAYAKTSETLQGLGMDYEVIIVDDLSNDRTWTIIEDIARKDSRVSVICHKKNFGCGGAFRTGVLRAQKDYVVFVPADNPLSPEDMAAYLPRMGVCDIIVGVRAERVGYPHFARFASFVYNRILVPLLFNIGISDVNWIQFYKRKLFTDKLIEIEHDGIFFLVEILIKARRNRLIVAEVPASMRKRMYGKPSANRLSVMWRTGWDMVHYFWKIYFKDSVRR